MPPKLPTAGPLTGNEVAVVIQGGKPVTTPVQAIADRGPTATGPKGDKGDKGYAGSVGPTGPSGAKGDTGATGAAGSTGAAGAQGPSGAAGPTGLKGDTGATGAKGDTGAAGTPKRIDRFTASTDSNGIATVTFSPAFAATPDIDVIEGWSGDQMITGAVVAGSSSASGCKVQVMVSRGTLLLTSGPFQKAAAGVSIAVRAIGN